MALSIITIIFLTISQFLIFSEFSYFWLIILAIFSFYNWRKLANEELKKFSIIFSPTMILTLSLIFLRWSNMDLLWKEFWILILIIFFFLISRFFQKKSIFRQQVLSVIFYISLIYIAIWFFYLGPLENFFIKQLILFISPLIILEGKRFLFGNKSSWLSSFVATLIMLELGWVLSLLPINFLSLAGIWVLSSYIVSEFLEILWQDSKFGAKFIIQVASVIILSLIIFVSSSWQII